MIEIYYKKKLINKTRTKEEADAIIKLFIEEKGTFYKQLYRRIDNYLGNLSNIRERKETELTTDYEKSLKITYRKEIMELDSIGKELLKKKYAGYYFKNSKDSYVGFYIKNSDDKDVLPLNLALFKCKGRIPKENDFEIIEA